MQAAVLVLLGAPAVTVLLSPLTPAVTVLLSPLTPAGEARIATHAPGGLAAGPGVLVPGLTGLRPGRETAHGQVQRHRPRLAGAGGNGNGAAMTISALVAAKCPPGTGRPACESAARDGTDFEVLVRAIPGPAGAAALARGAGGRQRARRGPGRCWPPGPAQASCSGPNRAAPSRSAPAGARRLGAASANRQRAPAWTSAW